MQPSKILKFILSTFFLILLPLLPLSLIIIFFFFPQQTLFPSFGILISANLISIFCVILVLISEASSFSKPKSFFHENAILNSALKGTSEIDATTNPEIFRDAIKSNQKFWFMFGIKFFSLNFYSFTIIANIFFHFHNEFEFLALKLNCSSIIYFFALLGSSSRFPVFRSKLHFFLDQHSSKISQIQNRRKSFQKISIFDFQKEFGDCDSFGDCVPHLDQYFHWNYF